MTQPAVSVLLPVHNGEPFLHEAIQSVIDQTFTDWELVAVLDRCTDNSEHVIREFRDDRIRIFDLVPPGGFANALNFGLTECRSELVARLDQDDVCLPNRLEKQLDVLTLRPNLNLLGTSARIIDETSQIVGFRSVITGVRELGLALLRRNQFIHPSVIFRRKLILEVGGYDPDAAPIFEDYDLWLRVVGHGDIDNISEPLIAYRRHEGQQSRGSRLYAPALNTLSRSRRQAGTYLGIPRLGLWFFDLYWFLTQVVHRLFIVGWRRSKTSPAN